MYQHCCMGREREAALRLHDIALGDLANGHPAAALAALRRALMLEYRLVCAHDSLGTALENLGRLGEAEAAYREALRLDETYAPAHRNLGELLRRLGRPEEARSCFEAALRLDPALTQCRIALANTLIDLGELQAAASCCREALARSPNGHALHMDLGRILWKAGDSVGALGAFERAVIADPGAAEAHYNLGSVRLELGQFDAAVGSAREAVRLRPGFSEALTLYAAGLAASGAIEEAMELLGQATGHEVASSQRWLLLAARLMNSRLFEPARHCLEKALQEKPNDATARHLMAALTGENPESPIEGYVRRLFDASAATFDEDLVRKLGYDVPREMVAVLRAMDAGPEGVWDVLDLGCGTGLVGVEIVSQCRHLVGIDLAPNMIQRCRDREVYTHLHCADLLEGLANEEKRRSRYHVVTAADVFIYVGKLDTVVPAVRRVLHPGGLFAFSAEALESIEADWSHGYRLGVMGRYAHSADYLRRLAMRSGFHVELLRDIRIRFEHRRPVQGWLTVWRAA
jgi:predicted TPR repeat methyltransferase